MRVAALALNFVDVNTHGNTVRDRERRPDSMSLYANHNKYFFCFDNVIICVLWFVWVSRASATSRPNAILNLKRR